MEKETMNRDTVDLIRLVKVLLKRKWLVILGTVLFTLAALGITMVLPKAYQSEGFIQLSSGVDIDLEELREIQKKIREEFQTKMYDNITLQRNMLLNEALRDSGLMLTNVSIPDYKKYLSQFTSPNRFLKFVKKNREAGEKRLEELKLNIRSSEDIAQWLEPVYAYSKQDLSDLGQVSKDVKNFVVGVKVQAEQGTPKAARALVSVFGRFIKESILFGKLDDYIQSSLNKSRTDPRSYENLVIKDQFKLDQLMRKRNHMQEVLKKYPRANTIENRGLVSLDFTGHRYLSPVAQLVGIESHIADIKENLANNKRNQQLEELKFEYFSKTNELLEKQTFGGVLLTQCVELAREFSPKLKVPEDVLRQARNELLKDFDNFRNLGNAMQFLSGPTTPTIPVKPRKGLITAIAFVLGFCLFIFLAFFMEWWQNSKQ
jgi:LPS O-antigen subunit length determinant protein (WzzB/FepE family)